MTVNDHSGASKDNITLLETVCKETRILPGRFEVPPLWSLLVKRTVNDKSISKLA